MTEQTAQEFQFHKGTIKTHPLADAGTSEHLFQFHKGTIKTTSAT